jgi:hypothetical protein
VLAEAETVVVVPVPRIVVVPVGNAAVPIVVVPGTAPQNGPLLRLPPFPKVKFSKGKSVKVQRVI